MLPGRPAAENRPVILDARKTEPSYSGETELSRILAPGGKPVGRTSKRTKASIRTVTQDEFDRLMNALQRKATTIPKPLPYQKYDGDAYLLPSGDVFGVRLSMRFGDTIDVLHSVSQSALPDGFKIHVEGKRIEQ